MKVFTWKWMRFELQSRVSYAEVKPKVCCIHLDCRQYPFKIQHFTVSKVTKFFKYNRIIHVACWKIFKEPFVIIDLLVGCFLCHKSHFQGRALQFCHLNAILHKLNTILSPVSIVMWWRRDSFVTCSKKICASPPFPLSQKTGSDES